MLNRPQTCATLSGGVPPYSLSVRAAADHFGFSRHTLYRWISDGKLIQNRHYLKVGKKTVIVRHAFIEYMQEVSRGCTDTGAQGWD